MRRVSFSLVGIMALLSILGCPDKASRDTSPTPTPTDVAAPSPDTPEPGLTPTPTPTIDWRFTPATLDVYRDTRVTFSLDVDEAVPATWRCEWDFGDGAPLTEGCRVEHLYRGGHSDQQATLRVFDGERTFYEGSSKVPLERLPVVPMGTDSELDRDLAIPPPPAPGETSFRLVVLSDSAGPEHAVAAGAELKTAVEAIVARLRPSLVLHNGNMVHVAPGDESAGKRAWQRFHDQATRPLRAADIPLIPAPGDRDAGSAGSTRALFRAEWTRPENRPALVALDDTDYPFAYSFSHKGAHFLVMDGATGEVSEARMRWLRQQLDAAGIYPLRFVFSHVPLHRFADLQAEPGAPGVSGEEGELSGGLQKHFRIYNLLLEHNVSLFVSSHHEVYFKGRYGALRVVATGNSSGARGRLSGQRESQEPSLVVIDVADGRLAHIFAVTGPDYVQRFDEDSLPDEVEVYRYDPTFTPGQQTGAPPAGLLSP